MFLIIPQFYHLKPYELYIITQFLRLGAKQIQDFGPPFKGVKN